MVACPTPRASHAHACQSICLHKRNIGHRRPPFSVTPAKAMHVRLIVRRTRRQQHQDGKQERAIYRTARPRRESQPFRPSCPRCAHSNTRCHLRDISTRVLCVSAGRYRHRCVLCSAQTCPLELGTHHSPAATAAAPRSMVLPSGISLSPQTLAFCTTLHVRIARDWTGLTARLPWLSCW